MERFGEPQEVTGVASFLYSPDASYTTGQPLAVNGGQQDWRLHQNNFSQQAATQKVECLSVSEKNELLFNYGINFEELATLQKRGTEFYWTSVEKTGFNPKFGKKALTLRRCLRVDMELPVKDAYDTFLRNLLADGYPTSRKVVGTVPNRLTPAAACKNAPLPVDGLHPDLRPLSTFRLHRTLSQSSPNEARYFRSLSASLAWAFFLRDSAKSLRPASERLRDSRQILITPASCGWGSR